MIGVRWHGPKDIRVERLPDPPPPEEGWVRLKITACGICGTDIHEYEHGPIAIPKTSGPRHLLPPLILGHEFSGVVEALGPGTEGISIGTTVVVDAGISCGHCYFCTNDMKNLCVDRGIQGLTLDGGFAEYINVPIRNCYPVNHKISPDILALAEPLTVAIHAVNRSRSVMEDDALVIGGGPIGLMITKVLLLRGVKNVVGIIEPVETRRNLAVQLGAHYAIDPKQQNFEEGILEKTSGVGASVVFECVGSPRTYQLALHLTRKRGRTVLVGSSPEPTPINFRDFLKSEKEIIGSVGRSDEWQDAIELLEREEAAWRLLISERMSLKDAPEAFKRLTQDRASYIKIVVGN